MPFKTLASLKKVLNMGSELVDIAPLEDARIVLAISSDTVKVQAVPFSGLPSKPHNIALDQVTTGALINKKVAVVKSGDELWALLDIQHKPKIEQVGRDIRSLHQCPAGKTALAVGWDGNGAALAFENNEVGGRQFTLRGSIRTACLDGKNTYVIADQGSGQLRVHAGSTPESGASARCDLPAAAAEHDLLEGGEELCASSKKGSDSVCVMRREGSGFRAIMLGTARVVDMAVISTSLFVLGEDGRLRVYGAEVLAHGGDHPDPTTEMDLKTTGRPLCLAATTRLKNTLWVGTYGGDLIRCDAIKGNINI